MTLDELLDACIEATAKPHGHVIPSLHVTRCGGPGLCRHCLLEEIYPNIKAAVHIRDNAFDILATLPAQILDHISRNEIKK